MVSAFEAGEVHTNYETAADFVEILDGLGLTKSEVVTSATLVCRAKATDPVLKDQKVRRALQIAVDNAVVLQLGYGNAGTVAENHHVCPIHPEYAELPKSRARHREGQGNDDRGRPHRHRVRIADV